MDPPFHTTRWSLVLAASPAAPEGRKALDELCEAYWYPLYVYLRRTGTGDQQARDLVQGFIAELLECGAPGPVFKGADPSSGPFRGYIIGALRHHVANARRAAQAQKRGGGRLTSLDLSDPRHAAAERFGRSSHTLRPEQAFERAWALELVARATARLAQEYEDRQRGPMFEALRDTLDGSSGAKAHDERAAALGCSVGAVKVNLHRLRVRMGELLREEVAQTVAVEGVPGGQAEIEAELRQLIAVLGGRFEDSL